MNIQGTNDQNQKNVDQALKQDPKLFAEQILNSKMWLVMCADEKGQCHFHFNDIEAHALIVEYLLSQRPLLNGMLDQIQERTKFDIKPIVIIRG